MCACVFFFKRKTACEMRISDWSSDVCSSDLGIDGQARIAAEPGILAGQDQPAEIAQLAQAAFGRLFGMQHQRGTAHRQRLCPERLRTAAYEIGRASWRERVCQ